MLLKSQQYVNSTLALSSSLLLVRVHPCQPGWLLRCSQGSWVQRSGLPRSIPPVLGELVAGGHLWSLSLSTARVQPVPRVGSVHGGNVSSLLWEVWGRWRMREWQDGLGKAPV